MLLRTENVFVNGSWFPFLFFCRQVYNYKTRVTWSDVVCKCVSAGPSAASDDQKFGGGVQRKKNRPIFLQNKNTF